VYSEEEICCTENVFQEQVLRPAEGDFGQRCRACCDGISLTSVEAAANLPRSSTETRAITTVALTFRASMAFAMRIEYAVESVYQHFVRYQRRFERSSSVPSCDGQLDIILASVVMQGGKMPKVRDVI
jgi:hypothetical protein